MPPIAFMFRADFFGAQIWNWSTYNNLVNIVNKDSPVGSDNFPDQKAPYDSNNYDEKSFLLSMHTNNEMTTTYATLSPCQGRLVLVKYINTYPNDSISSRRLVKERKYNIFWQIPVSKKHFWNVNVHVSKLFCTSSQQQFFLYTSEIGNRFFRTNVFSYHLDTRSYHINIHSK